MSSPLWILSDDLQKLYFEKKCCSARKTNNNGYIGKASPQCVFSSIYQDDILWESFFMIATFVWPLSPGKYLCCTENCKIADRIKWTLITISLQKEHILYSFCNPKRTNMLFIEVFESYCIVSSVHTPFADV